MSGSDSTSEKSENPESGGPSQADSPPRANSFYSKQRLGSHLLLVLILAFLFGTFLIIKPYIHAIILAAIFAIIFSPLHNLISKKIKGKENLAAFCTSTVVALLVIVPLLIFTTMLVVKGVQSFKSVKTWVLSGEMDRALMRYGIEVNGKTDDTKTETNEEDWASTGDGKVKTPETPDDKDDSPKLITEPKMELTGDDQHIEAAPAKTAKTEEVSQWQKDLVQKVVRLKNRFYPDLTADNVQDWLVARSKSFITLLADQTLPLLKNAMDVIINFVMMIFIMFFFFRDGSKISSYILSLSPLNSEYEALLMDRVKNVSKGAVLGTGLTALAQGILGMIAFAIVGIPWFFWGVVMMFASLIPVVGTALLWVPCCVYLFFTGNTGECIFLAIWCAVIVNAADNFVRPMVMGGNSGMSSIIAFFAILGGMQLFGLIGVIYGPLICGVFILLLYIYKLEMTIANPDLEVADAKD